MRFSFEFQALLRLAVLALGAAPISTAAVSCSTSPSNAFGNVFLSNAGQSLARGPLTMVLPSDSGYSSPLPHHRRRRHVVCGRTQRKAKAKTFEERAVCAFHHVLNKNERRMPVVLEEVTCDCERPSHLSPYTEIRCQPIKYQIPVLLQDDNGVYQPAHEELTLACIPVAPKPDDDFEMIDL